MSTTLAMTERIRYQELNCDAFYKGGKKNLPSIFFLKTILFSQNTLLKQFQTLALGNLEC